MSEEEEFEFRHRLEKERAVKAPTPSPVAAQAKEPTYLDRVASEPLAMLGGNSLRQVRDQVAGGVRGAGGIGATLLWPVDKVNDILQGDRRPTMAGMVTGQQPLSRNEERRNDMTAALGDLGVNTDSTEFAGGKLAGEIAGTAGVGPALAGGARVMGAAPSIVRAIETAGFSTGAPATAGLAAGVKNMATRAAGGAVTGAASAGLVNPEDAAAGAAVGAALPPALTALGKAGNAIGTTARAVRGAVEPLTRAGRDSIAGRTLNAVAGDDADVINRIAAGAEIVPGSAPTVGQLAENGGLAALERTAAAKNPAAFTTRELEQASARGEALRSVAQDKPAYAAAEAARKEVTDPLYAEATKANYVVDGRLATYLQRPAVQQAMQRAETLAKNQGREFTFFAPLDSAKYVPSVPYPTTVRGIQAEEQRRLAMESSKGAFAGVGGAKNEPVRKITGQGLQDLKMAMDEMLSDPASGFTGKAGDTVKALRGQLVNWMEDANPAFKEARTTFARMSAPINQMDIGSDLLNKLAPALSDHGALGRETAAQFALALRNAPATAKHATKFPGASLEKIMTPEQMELLNNVARDLARKSNAQTLGKGSGSDTLQKLSMSNIAERSGAPGVVTRVLEAPVVRKLTQGMYSGPDQRIQALITDALLDPQTAATLMRSAANPAPVKNLAVDPALQQLFYRAAPVSAGR